MRAARWLLLIVVLLGIALLGALRLDIVSAFGFLPSWMSAGGDARPRPAPEAPATRIPISTSEPIFRVFALRLSWVGVVQSRASVRLEARWDGQIESIDVADQAHVESGQIVMRLGGERVRSEEARLQAKIASLEARRALARETTTRLRQSFATRMVTRNVVDASAQAELRIDGEWEDARLALRALEKQREVRSPLIGVFTDRLVSPGQIVRAGDRLAEILDVDHLRIVAAFFPPEGVDLLGGKPATVRLGNGQRVDGTIVRVLPQAAPNGATQAWITSEAIDHTLRPGLTVSGDVVLETTRSLAVPASAVVYDDHDQAYVLALIEGDPVRVPIQVGKEQDGWVEVLAGLGEDQAVVVRGAYPLFHRQFSQQYRIAD